MQHSLSSADASTGPEGAPGICSIKLQPVPHPPSLHSVASPRLRRPIEVPAQERTLSGARRRLRGAESPRRNFGTAWTTRPYWTSWDRTATPKFRPR